MKIVVHYAEIGLKGRNRPRFENGLRDNLRRHLRSLVYGKGRSSASSDTPGEERPEGRIDVAKLHGRLVVTLPDDVSWDEARGRIGDCFGVAYFSRVTSCAPTLDAIGEAVDGFVDARSFQTFGIKPRRAEKHHPFTSSDLAIELGNRVSERTGAKVDLGDPDLWIEVHVLQDEALILHERVPGPGGMPVGSAGRALALISGGIDSPVAAFQLMKRGARMDFVHFHSAPFTSRASLEKVRDMIGHLAVRQGRSSLFAVPFGELQKELIRAAPAEPRIVLYRRFMLRIAQALAEQTGALALVTGESLGQVSSQTLGNLDTIGRVADLPVLRPLIGMDKSEIILRAHEIGTFDISVEPDEDCCSFLMPSRPATWTRPDRIERVEASFDVARMVESCLARTEREEIEPIQ